MGFIMDFASGFMSGLTGQNISFSQNAPSYNYPIAQAPKSSLGFVKYEKWTPDSGISLYYNPKNKKAVTAQQKLHSQYTALGMNPYIGTTYANEKVIVWQTPQTARATIGKMDVMGYISNHKYQQQNVTSPESVPKLQRETVSGWGRTAKYTSGFCNFVSRPFTTATKWVMNNPPDYKPSWWETTLTSSLDVGVAALSAIFCPPLFLGQVGCAMGGAAIDYS